MNIPAGLGRAVPSAGEVEQFAYCPHNWWLARQGIDPHDAGSVRGMGEHKELGRQQKRATASQREAGRALKWMFRVLAMAGSATFLTLEVVYLRGDPLHWLFLATALVLVAASAALLAIAGLEEREYRRRVVAAGLVPGEVARGGWRGEEVLTDPEWSLSGAPDYVMDTASGPVPVEVKTGHTPERPYESHVLQLAAYLRLLEADGQSPPYGLVNYPEGVFRIAWDDALRQRLRQHLERMAEAERLGRADRDHEHVNRCVGCARRQACTQRLA